MKAKPPTLTLAGREYIASAADDVRLPTKCVATEPSGTPWPFWTRESGECRLKERTMQFDQFDKADAGAMDRLFGRGRHTIAA